MNSARAAASLLSVSIEDVESLTRFSGNRTELGNLSGPSSTAPSLLLEVESAGVKDGIGLSVMPREAHPPGSVEAFELERSN